jgi:hypothetical protein
MKFLYGTITHTLPKGWTPPDVWPEFGILAQPVSIVDREEVGIHPRGVRWSLWPFTFEEYIGENEPNMQDSKTGNLARNRIIYWKRITNTPVPSRWRALGRPWRIDGFYTFTEEDYTKTWSTDAKRKLNHWRNMHAHKHRIEKISFEEYSTAYTHSTVAKKVGTDLLHILERKLTLPQCAPHIERTGVR